MITDIDMFREGSYCTTESFSSGVFQKHSGSFWYKFDALDVSETKAVRTHSE